MLPKRLKIFVFDIENSRQVSQNKNLNEFLESEATSSTDFMDSDDGDQEWIPEKEEDSVESLSSDFSTSEIDRGKGAKRKKPQNKNHSKRRKISPEFTGEKIHKRKNAEIGGYKKKGAKNAQLEDSSSKNFSIVNGADKLQEIIIEAKKKCDHFYIYFAICF